MRIFNLPLGSHPTRRECPGKTPQDQPLGRRGWINPFLVTVPVTWSHSSVDGIMSLLWGNMEFQRMLQRAGMSGVWLHILSCTLQASPFHYCDGKTPLSHGGEARRSRRQLQDCFPLLVRSWTFPRFSVQPGGSRVSGTEPDFSQIKLLPTLILATPVAAVPASHRSRAHSHPPCVPLPSSHRIPQGQAGLTPRKPRKSWIILMCSTNIFMADPFQMGYSSASEEAELVSPGDDTWDQGLDVTKARMWLDYGCDKGMDVTKAWIWLESWSIWGV